MYLAGAAFISNRAITGLCQVGSGQGRLPGAVRRGPLGIAGPQLRLAAQ